MCVPWCRPPTLRTRTSPAGQTCSSWSATAPRPPSHSVRSLARPAAHLSPVCPLQNAAGTHTCMAARASWMGVPTLQGGMQCTSSANPNTPLCPAPSVLHWAPQTISFAPSAATVDWSKWDAWFNDSSTRFCALLTEKMALVYSGRTSGTTLNLPCRDAGAPACACAELRQQAEVHQAHLINLSSPISSLPHDARSNWRQHHPGPAVHGWLCL